MFTLFFRGMILYAVMILVMRALGKRQLGQFQPYEFAMTILLADVISAPMESVSTPLLHGLLPVAAMVVVHGIITLASLRSDRVRAVVSGRPALVISKGVINQAELNRLCLSLSDLLVSADEVRRNIRSVAQSLLPMALYNPAGRKRRDLLEETLAVFREHRGRDVLCAYVKNAGREQETKWVGKLSEFPAAEVDMSTLIIIGGPRTRLDSGVLYEPRGYVEKYME